MIIIMEFNSKDYKFGLNITQELINEALVYIAKSNKNETGGILIGRYNEERTCANIKTISGPPNDSKCGPTWFERGIHGLQALLSDCWQKKEYYIGEWHFHPGGSSDPSNRDINQMTDIARSQKYSCPEPVLFIIGGNAINYTCKAFVVLRDRKVIDLNRSEQILKLK